MQASMAEVLAFLKAHLRLREGTLLVLPLPTRRIAADEKTGIYTTINAQALTYSCGLVVASGYLWDESCEPEHRAAALLGQRVMFPTDAGAPFFIAPVANEGPGGVPRSLYWDAATSGLGMARVIKFDDVLALVDYDPVNVEELPTLWFEEKEDAERDTSKTA